MAHKILLPAILLLMAVSSPAEAQSGEEDVIYFKDGGILRGQILERDEQGQSLMIETAGRNIFIVRLEEVQSIGREDVPKPQYFKKSGYMNQTGIDILHGRGRTSVRFQMVNGYQFTPRVSAGFGISLVPYSDPLNLVPFYLDFKVKFLEANTTPFVFLKSGYSISLLSETDIPVESHSGGLMLNPGIGIQFDTGSGFGWYFNAGYNMDHATFDEELWDGRTLENDITYRRVLFGMGVTF